MHAILGEPLSISPEQSDYESDSGTDSTLEDHDLFPTWGYPLQRLGRRRSNESMSSSPDLLNSDAVDDIDFDKLIDDLLAEDPFSLSETRNIVVVAASSSAANDSMVIKRMHRTAPELFILLRLNEPELRQDPWNPAPHIICAVSRDEHVFLCLQRLVEFNQPPLQTVSNYIDFFRQVLEGVTFLHEHSIAQLSCRDLFSYMMDLGSPTSLAPDSVDAFDRTRFPVKYYFTSLCNASEFESRDDEAFQTDVVDCAMMMQDLAVTIPAIPQKLNTLVNAMRTGTFDADASRKLFEALCAALPADVFDVRVPAIPSQAQPEVVVLSPLLPAAASSPDLRSIRSSAERLRTLDIPRKPKCNMLSPLTHSPPRARSTGADL
ncbi:hypothetical protein GGX14DRAFT_574793 [Mycena pura]|uniref:Protein kinase domain-containing protein n=1 Tax=Mycena pura TaxID=153505 RepID=A0AAD6Y1B1_9AGAR|nr:hypothetical protein GGX14DRAFT_574793 [Mycena pura]